MGIPIPYIFLLLSLALTINPINISAQPYTIKKIGIEQGLSNNQIKGITQDRNGFLWFATESGLNRFDGRTFTVYKKNTLQTNSINSNELNQVLADPNDNIIWIATQRNGLNAYDYSTHTFYHYTKKIDDPNGIIADDVTNLAFAPDGNLWLSTYHAGIEYYNKKTKQFSHYNNVTIPGLVSNRAWSVTDDQEGKLYIGHTDKGLSVISLKDSVVKNYRFDPNNPNSLPANGVNCVFISKKKNVWLGTYNGLALFNPETEKFTVFKNIPGNPSSLLSNFVLYITELKDNKLIVGTENGGVSILDLSQVKLSEPNNISFQNIVAKDDDTGLSNPSITAILQDSFGNIWLGSYGGGINFISNRSDFFKTWAYSPLKGVENSLSSKTAWGICADDKNRLWIGTERGGIDLYERGIKIKNYRKATSSLPDDIILSALKDSEGNLWFGTFENGAVVHDKYTGQFNKIKSVPKIGNRVQCLFEDKEKNIWIGTNDGVFSYNLKTKSTRIFNLKNSKLGDNLVRSISQDSMGRLWIGTLGKGLFIFTSQFNYVQSFYIGKGFCSNGITHIFRDSKNRMWVGTREGLVRFNSCDDTLYRVYKEKDGLADSYIRAITEGLPGKIWVSTNGGISCFTEKDNLFINFNHSDGIPMGIFMDGSVTKTSDGNIYFGSQNGVCYFDSDNEQAAFKLPLPVISDFKIYDKHIAQTSYENSVPVTKEINLGYKQNTFSISFNVLDYALNNQVEFMYSLKGLDGSWYQLHNDNQVTFRNIPPGNYEFLLKARIHNQKWTNDATSLQININPPFWLTWWAKINYFVFFIFTTAYIIRFYKRKLNLENALLWEQKNNQKEHELNNERLSFYTNIAHELRTPLTLIIGPLEDLKDEKSLSPAHVKKISLIYRNANRLFDLINQILEFRKTESQNRHLCVVYGDISNLIQEIGLKFKEFNKNKNISFDINIETQDVKLYFDPEVITIILDNLISNAFKNTKKGEIVLSLRSVIKDKTHYTEIEVRDTGHGIPSDALPKIFDRYYQVKSEYQVSGSGIGLSLVKNLAELHHGYITVQSSSNKGSSFCFQLITNNTYPDALHAHPSEQKPEVYEETSDDKRQILIVEDNAEICEYIASSFSGLYKTLIAENGKVGMELAFAHMPDVIISDIMMPVMDGFELCKILKEDIRTCHIPLILLTAKDTLHDKTEGYLIGADSYITKPFSAKLLQNRIENILESRRRIVELFSSNSDEKRKLLVESLSILDNDFIQKVTSIIEKNLDSEKINIAYIADQMNMSHSTLYRKIKALTGLSANEFIRKIKIKNAEQLLLTGKFSISEIAYKVGINSIPYFRQYFKAEYGVAPSEYINQIKGQRRD
jgi:ligand-binding sensor domain-containing protein/signal transduction histidine kinase/DNA-binding response OmpR family regulator